MAECGNTDVAFFSQLREGEFGRTIIQTIQVELGQENSAERILALLR
jgi:hypothetical protein